MVSRCQTFLFFTARGSEWTACIYLNGIAYSKIVTLQLKNFLISFHVSQLSVLCCIFSSYSKTFPIIPEIEITSAAPRMLHYAHRIYFIQQSAPNILRIHQDRKRLPPQIAVIQLSLNELCHTSSLCNTGEYSPQCFFSQIIVNVLIMAVDLFMLELSVVFQASFKFATKHFIFMNI